MEKELWEFLELVQEMREMQKKYFRHRDSNDLQKSKELEAKVDNMAYSLQSKRLGELF